MVNMVSIELYNTDINIVINISAVFGNKNVYKSILSLLLLLSPKRKHGRDTRSF